MSRKRPSLESIKSLPAVDFRLTGSADSENGELRNEVIVENEDSPYSGNSVVVREEDGSPAADEHLDSSSRESRWADTTSYATKKKLQYWYKLSNGNWALGQLLTTSGTESVISLPEGNVLKVKSESLVPANPDILDGVDDLMQLSYLNEPSVLYNLQYRYKQDMIYTKAGPVLVAIFKKVPLYGNDYIEAYKNKSYESPHVYAITDTAIREMRRDEVNQSIIIRCRCE